MRDHPWPLKKKLPKGHVPLTKAELVEILESLPDDAPLWIDNHRQPIRSITQRPVDLMYIGVGGLHIA